MATPEQIRDVRERTDIVSLIGDHVVLKRVGASFRGLCPFHSEKSPSFYVHPDRQFFHCFGCQASGDVIEFTMRLDGRTFAEALRVLAERAGVVLETVDPAAEARSRQAQQRSQRLFALVDAAAGFYLEQIKVHTHAKYARDELEKRGVHAETEAAYRLGYAPSGWDSLARFLAAQGFSGSDGEEVGLLLPRRQGGGHIDRFRHRLMFPISDTQGRIVAFSGRILPSPETGEISKEEGKYINSPETSLYKKGELLFGLHEARVVLRREDMAHVCEGNFDVLALYQAGIPNVVAPLGTAFTAAQAKLLKRYVTRVALVFDSDKAGMKAVRAAFPLLASANLAARVCTFPEGDDPDSFLRKHGDEALRIRIAESEPILEHLIERAATRAGYDPNLRAQAVEELGPLLVDVKNPVELGLYIERIASVFGIHDVGAVKAQLRKGVLAQRRNERPQRPSLESIEPPPSEEEKNTEEKREAPLSAIEADFVGALLDMPDLLAHDLVAEAMPFFQSQALRALVSRMQVLREAGPLSGIDLLAGVESKNVRQWLAARLPITQFSTKESALSLLTGSRKLLEKQFVEREQKRLQHAIVVARRMGQLEEATELERERNRLFQAFARPPQ